MLSYVYDAYGMSTVYNSAANSAKERKLCSSAGRVTVLGVEGYKHLTAEKVAVTPTIAEQILEMARKKKEEQETIKVGPEDYDVLFL